MWLTTARSAPTPQLRNGQLAYRGVNASWPKGDCAVASNASVVRHIVFRPLLAFGDSRLRSKNTAGLLCTSYFQMEMARMMSEKRTFAALESFSVPITMRIAQDSNWA